MRYLWIGALVGIALLGAACSGSTPRTTTRTTVHHRYHRHRTTTTTTTAGATHTTAPNKKLPAGPKDLLACASFGALGRDAHKGHRRIQVAFQKLFRDLKHAENTRLRRTGHAAAVELLQDQVRKFKRSFTAIYETCYAMQVGTPST